MMSSNHVKAESVAHVSVAAGCSQNNSLETDNVVVDIQRDDTIQIAIVC